MRLQKTAVALVTVVLSAVSVDGALAATRWVNDDGTARPPGTNCRTAAYKTIQAAVDAATSGDTINVCPGTYHEQVVINKTLYVRGVEYDGEKASIISPRDEDLRAFSDNTRGPAPDWPRIAPIVFVRAGRVRLENLTIDGRAVVNPCVPNLVGVYYRNSSGVVNLSAVRNIQLSEDDCQSGIGILVQTDPGKQSVVDILGNSVHHYHKNGIVGQDAGTRVNMIGNQVSGIGPTKAVSQNGLLLLFGATGRIEANSVINHLYAPCVSADDCPNGTYSASIYLFGVSNARIAGNHVSRGQVGIYVAPDNLGVPSTNNRIEHNTIYDAGVIYAIEIHGDDNIVSGNAMVNSVESAIEVEGANNKILNNLFNETPCGIELEGATGTSISGNQFFNTKVKICGS